jgi:hypothetical protein
MSPHRISNGADDAKESELYSKVRQVDVDFKRFFGVGPARVDRRFTLTLSEQTYLPKVILNPVAMSSCTTTRSHADGKPGRQPPC